MTYLKDKLGNLLALEYGSPLPEQQRDGFGFPVFGSNGEIGRHSQALIKGPGIILGRKGSVGEVEWTSEDFWPIDTTYFVVPKEGVKVRWLYWLLESLNLRKLDAATGVPGLNRNDVYALSCYKPRPEEQWQIATVLDTVDEAIASTEAVISKLRQVRAGLLHDLLTRGLDENGELRGPEQFKDSPLGKIPREWRIESLWVECARHGGSIQTGPFGSQLHDEDYVTDGTPIITVEHLREGEIIHANLPRVSEKDRIRLSRYLLQKGDLVFSRVGAIDRCALVSAVEDGWLFSGRCLRVRPGSNGMNSQYLSLQLNSYWSRRWIRSHAVGSTMQCLNTMILSNLPVTVPFPEEQEAIAVTVSSHDEILRQEQTRLSKLASVKSGLMSDLLTGRVRVPENLELPR